MRCFWSLSFLIWLSLAFFSAAWAACGSNRCTANLQAFHVSSSPSIVYQVTERDMNLIGKEISTNETLRNLQIYPDDVVQKLEAIRNKTYLTKKQFLQELENVMGKLTNETKYITLSYASKESPLVCAIFDADLSPLSCKPISGVLICGDANLYRGQLQSALLIGKPLTFVVSDGGECLFQRMEQSN